MCFSRLFLGKEKGRLDCMRQIETKKLIEIFRALRKGVEVPNPVCFLLYVEAFVSGQVLFSEVNPLLKLCAVALVFLTVISVWLFYSKNKASEEAGRYDEHSLVC
jgi:high-affinity K+ transport system ATPase subunit B